MLPLLLPPARRQRRPLRRGRGAAGRLPARSARGLTPWASIGLGDTLGDGVAGLEARVLPLSQAEGEPLAAGGGLEFRPIPVHGLFGEALYPLGGEPLAWSAGARLYTRGHHFSLYAASPPALSLAALASPAEGLSVGFAIDRAFRL